MGKRGKNGEKDDKGINGEKTEKERKKRKIGVKRGKQGENGEKIKSNTFYKGERMCYFFKVTLFIKGECVTFWKCNFS